MAKAKKPFLSGYKTYKPEVEGYGSPDDWKDAFHQKMNFDEAIDILSNNDPYKILGINKNATFAEIKKAYRKLAMIHHPDKNPDNQEESTEIMKKLTAAYTILEKKFKR